MGWGGGSAAEIALAQLYDAFIVELVGSSRAEAPGNKAPMPSRMAVKVLGSDGIDGTGGPQGAGALAGPVARLPVHRMVLGVVAVALEMGDALRRRDELADGGSYGGRLGPVAALMLAAKFHSRERRENICSVKATGGHSGSKSSCAYLVPGRKGGNRTGKKEDS